MFDLTTVHQPVARQGLVAGQMVHQILEKGEVDAPHVTLPTHVVARGTSGPPPG
jgi:LacI family transcriptional regulator